jgi:phosphohistidine phosphatase SixA
LGEKWWSGQYQFSVNISDEKPKYHTINALVSNSKSSLEEIIREAQERTIELSEKTTIAIVGHEPQLRNVLADLIDVKVDFEFAEAVVISVDSFSKFGNFVVLGKLSGGNTVGRDKRLEAE